MIDVSRWVEAKFGSTIAKLYRFVVVGGGVTLLSLALSYFFLKILGTPLVITYVLLYIATILLSYILNSRYTFGVKRDWMSLLQFYGSYIVTLGLGTGALHLLRKQLPYENWVLVFIVVPFTMVTNFVLSSLIFSRNSLQKDTNEL